MAATQLTTNPIRLLALLLFLSFATCAPSPKPQPANDRQLVWQDEFNTPGQPDTAKWNYAVGGHGWGNREQQFYTDARPENARLENGILIIEARREPWKKRDYTSARLTTRGKQDWTYGRFDIRARLPSGHGTWPAIWMLGSNIGEVGWPLCGEIDIMEHVGYNADSIFATTHTAAFNHVNGKARSGTVLDPTVETDFHTYSIDWRPDRIDFLFDGRPFHHFSRTENATAAEWPFDQPHYLLLNLAVGGAWGGRRGVDTTIWPQRLEVDWVRVYQ